MAADRDRVLAENARHIRLAILNMVTSAASSHVGSAFSCVEILTYIYGELLEQERAEGTPRSRFILSKGHAATALYATLAEFGYISADELASYGSEGSRLGGHPLKNTLPGIEAATGSLGHGLGIGAGLALGLPGEARVFVLMGDGECDEGSVWEAAMVSSRLKLGNLTVTVDLNGLQGYPLSPRVHSISTMFEAAGWRVLEIDGHDFTALRQAYADSRAGRREAPWAIIARTVKGKGVSFMENQLAWHYRSPRPGEYEAAREELSR